MSVSAASELGIDVFRLPCARPSGEMCRCRRCRFKPLLATKQPRRARERDGGRPRSIFKLPAETTSTVSCVHASWVSFPFPPRTAGPGAIARTPSPGVFFCGNDLLETLAIRARRVCRRCRIFRSEGRVESTGGVGVWAVSPSRRCWADMGIPACGVPGEKTVHDWKDS